MSLHLRVFTGPMWSGKTSALIDLLQCPSFLPACPRVGVKHAIDHRSPPSVMRSRAGHCLHNVTSASSLAEVPVRAGVVYGVDEAQFFGDGGDGLAAFWQRVVTAHVQQSSTPAPHPSDAPRGDEVISGMPHAFPASCATLQSTALVVAGLDLDFKRNEFGGVLALCRSALSSSTSPLPGLIGATCALDFQLTRMSARCTFKGSGEHACCQPACFSQRLSAGGADGEALVLVGGAQLYQPACPRHHSLHAQTLVQWDASLEAARIDSDAGGVLG